MQHAMAAIISSGDSGSWRKRRIVRTTCCAFHRSNDPPTADHFIRASSTSTSLSVPPVASLHSSIHLPASTSDQKVTCMHNTSMRWRMRSSRQHSVSIIIAAFALLLALDDNPWILDFLVGVHGHKPSPPRQSAMGNNIRSLITNGRRHISARSYMAASILVASSSGGHGKRCLPHVRMRRGGHADFDTRSTSVAYNQDALIDEEATWIMEEEYRGASKRKQRKRKGGKKEMERTMSSKGEYDDSDDERWWENDPWDDGDDRACKKEEDDDATTPIEEHPLRTDEWLVRVKVGGFPWSSAKENGMLFTECSYDALLAKNDDIKVPKRSELGRRERVQRLKFSRNGLVWAMGDASANNSAAATKTAIGKWKIDHTGLHWDVEVAVPPPPPSKAANVKAIVRDHTAQEEWEDEEAAQITTAAVDLNAADWGSFAAIAAGGSKDKKEAGASVQGWRTTTLHYRADIHLNKFGERPRMFKGVITRDRYSVIGNILTGTKKAPSLFGLSLPTRTSLFRPVVATFEACGSGEDTVDLSYRERVSGSSPKQK